jgi:hypothetical protein
MLRLQSRIGPSISITYRYKMEMNQEVNWIILEHSTQGIQRLFLSISNKMIILITLSPLDH